MKKNETREELLLENEKLKDQLADAEETLRAIRSGEVDALVISAEKGDQVFTLKGAEHPFRVLIEEMSEGAAMLAADDSILYCNNGFAGMLKTPLEKLMGTAIEHYITPSNEALFWELLRQGREGRCSGEITLLAGDGSFVPTQLSFNTLQTDDVRLVYLIATDLTGQKQIQDELQRARDELEIRVEERTAELVKSEQRWATTLTSISDAVISTDVEGLITFMNAEAEALTGWTFAEASAKSVTEVFNIINGYTRMKADNPVCRVITEGRIIGLANHTILVRKDGTEVPIDDSGAPIRDGGGKTTGVVLVFRDITERKRAEEALRESEGRLQSILDNSSNVVFLKDLEGRYITVNRRFEELFRVTRQDVVGKSDYDIFPREHADRFRQHDLLAQEKGGPFEIEEFVPHDDGLHVYISSKFPIFNAEGKPYAVCGIATDITERKRAEEALRESEARFRSVLDNSQDVIYRLNVQTGRYEYISPSAETVVGFSPDELMALDHETSLSMIHPDDMPAMRAVLARTEDTGKGEVEYRQQTKNGDYRWISNRMSIIRDRAGRPLYRNGNIRDITERKRAEEALLESAAKYKLLTESILDTFTAIDHNLKFTYWNRAAEELVGISANEALGKTVIEVFGDNEITRRAFVYYRECVKTRQPIRYETGNVIRGRKYDLEVRLYPTNDGVSIIGRDITERKMAEKALLKSHDELELRQIV
jgi:PAS domain S-box-containing protein